MRINSLTWEAPVVIAEDVVLLRFGLATGHLDPEDLAEITLPKTISKSRGVVFSGNMPNWLAARLVHIALLGGECLWAGLDTARGEGEADLGSVVRLQRACHLPDSAGPSPLAIATSERNGYVVQWFNIVTEANGRKGELDPTQLTQVRLPEAGDSNRGIVFVGKGPIWLFAQLALLAFGRYAWCGVCNMRNPGARATIVWSDDPTKSVGTYVPDLNEEEDRAIHVGPFGDAASRGELRQCAVAVLGAAHSGKSMFTYGLSECSRVEPAVWTLRANPDGEGHWSNETSIPLRDTYREQAKRNWDLPFAERMASVVRDLRPRSNVLFVDLAGLCSDELRLILRECSHAILLRRADGVGGDECERFIAACEEDGIELIANLTSRLDADRSVVDVELASGRLMGVVAGLERGNRAVGDLCEPVYLALMKRLVDY